MTPWQRRLRVVILLIAIACAVLVAFTIKKRPGAATRGIAPIESSAISKVIKGMIQRFNKEHEDVRVDFDESTSYADGSTRLVKPTVTTQRSNGRVFTITAKEAQQNKNGTDYDFTGDVRVTSNDGLSLATERASYIEADGTVHAPGPVQFTRGRASGSGTGFTYNKNTDVLTILERPSMRVLAGKGDDAMDVTSGSAVLNRPEKTIRFEQRVHIVRGEQTTDAESAVAYLTPDDEQLDRLELRTRAVVTGSPGGAGAGGSLRGLRGDEIDLKYGPDGRAIQTASIRGAASVQMTAPRPAGVRGSQSRGPARGGGRAASVRPPSDAPREIAANAINITMAGDGTTPAALGARENVKLTVPADGEDPARTIEAPIMDATGEEGHGLSRAHFTGGVQFREQSNDVSRNAKSEALDVKLTEGMAGLEEAVFGRSVRFEDGTVVATAATARYDLEKGFLALSGSATTAPPRVEDERITINATHIDLTLDGPKIKATGNVISELKPVKQDRAKQTRQAPDLKVPSMLKSDQPVIVTADGLDYDGEASHAVYSGNALLVQEPTRIKAKTIAIDDKSGDLAAAGDVFTVAMLQQGPDQKKERKRSSVTAAALKYEEATRRATYSGGAHMVSDEGDMTAARIELYLKESGDEVERAEAFEAVKLVEQGRRTSGVHLVYTSADEKYQVTGKPVSVVNRCGDETRGLALTLFKSTDKIVVDGNDTNPTTTTGRGTSCP
jgi:LPS export ABC transporter protein LptC/lipopolysaccharide transport protein LptA